MGCGPIGGLVTAGRLCAMVLGDGVVGTTTTVSIDIDMLMLIMTSKGSSSSRTTGASVAGVTGAVVSGTGAGVSGTGNGVVGAGTGDVGVVVAGAGTTAFSIDIDKDMLMLCMASNKSSSSSRVGALVAGVGATGASVTTEAVGNGVASGNDTGTVGDGVVPVDEVVTSSSSASDIVGNAVISAISTGVNSLSLFVGSGVPFKLFGLNVGFSVGTVGIWGLGTSGRGTTVVPALPDLVEVYALPPLGLNSLAALPSGRGTGVVPRSSELPFLDVLNILPPLENMTVLVY